MKLNVLYNVNAVHVLSILSFQCGLFKCLLYINSSVRIYLYCTCFDIRTIQGQMREIREADHVEVD